MWKNKFVAIVIIAASGFIGACSSGNDTPAGSQQGFDESQPITPIGLISSVTADGSVGVFFRGSPPNQVGSISLDALSDSNASINFISGGSTQIPVVSNSAFTTIFVTSGNEGYFRIDLPIATLASDVIATYNTIQLDGEQANINVNVQSATGDVSASQSLGVTGLVVGTGEVQVSVSWDTLSDVDLHLVEPDGTRIYYGNEVSLSGGTLDLDSNLACIIDGVNNENITYANATPPVGVYTVSLDYFLDCDVPGPTNYVVTVRAAGSVQTFSGVYIPENVNQERRTITTFEVR